MFKFAVLQNDDLMGILYLEVPYRYKFTRRFKIDDWFIVKPYDQGVMNKDDSILARVIITYVANCKLAPDTAYEEEVVEYRGSSPKKEFKAKMRELSKNFDKHEKEGFPHLEEVERKIKARRRKNVEGSVERASDGDNLTTKNLNLSAMKKPKLKDPKRQRSRDRLKKGENVTPDDLYSYAGKRKGQGNTDISRVNQKMAAEMASLRKELAETRAKLTAMEEGQMTVDNLQLTKQLEKEKQDLNKTRADLLKEYAKKDEALAEKQAQNAREMAQREADVRNQFGQLEEEKRKFQVDIIELKGKVADLNKKTASLQEREDDVQRQLLGFEEREKQLAREKEDLQDYNNELADLKDRLLEEREQIIKDSSENTKDKMDLERQIRELKLEKEKIEKQIEKKQEELRRAENNIALKEEKILKERALLQKDKDEVDDWKSHHVDKLKEVEALRSELEDEKVKLWGERNEMQKGLRQFMHDKHMLDKEIANQKKEIAIAAKELDQEREEIDEERGELQEFYDKLEEMEKNLAARENKLIDDQDSFSRLQKAFFDKLMKQGGHNAIDEEMRNLARELGLDIDEMIKTSKNLDAKRKELERLKEQNSRNYALMRRNSKISRPPSGGASRRASKLFLPGQGGIAGNIDRIGDIYKHKLLIAEYLKKLYDDAMMKTQQEKLDEEYKNVMSMKEDYELTKTIADRALDENRFLKKELQLLKEIIEELKLGGDIDLSQFIAEKQTKGVDTRDLVNLNAIDEVYTTNEASHHNSSYIRASTPEHEVVTRGPSHPGGLSEELKK